MNASTPHFSRRAEQERVYYISDAAASSGKQQGAGRPPRPGKQSAEAPVLIEQDLKMEPEQQETEETREESKESVIMGFLKQMVGASNLSGSILKKNEAQDGPQEARQPTIEEEEEEEEELEPRSAESLPSRVEKLPKDRAIRQNRREPSARSRSPIVYTATIARSRSPKPTKQEITENTYNNSMNNIKKHYANTLEQKRTKKKEEKSRIVNQLTKELIADKENSSPNISFVSSQAEQAGKIRRQRPEPNEQPQKPPTSGEMHLRAVEKTENEALKRKRTLFSAFSLPVEELTRVDTLKKEVKYLEYFKYVLELSLPRNTKRIAQFGQEEFYEQPREQWLWSLMSVSRLQILQTVDFFQLYQHSGLLREIHEAQNNIKKIIVSISKIQRENEAVSDAMKSQDVSRKKTLLSKSFKNTENETKIVLLSEMRNRLTQKVVIAALKYLRGATVVRVSLLSQANTHYATRVAYYAFAALHHYKEHAKEKRKVRIMAHQRVKELQTRTIWRRWINYKEYYKTKRSKTANAEAFSRVYALKKSFCGLKLKALYKKMLATGNKLAEEYYIKVTVARCFYGFKYGTEMQTALKNRIQVAYGDKKKDNLMSKSELQGQLVERLNKVYRDIKKRRLVVLASKHEYCQEPIRHTKSQLRSSAVTQRCLTAVTPRLEDSALEPRSMLIRKNLAGGKTNELSQLRLFERSLKYKRRKYISEANGSGCVIEDLKEHIVAMISVWKTLQDLPGAANRLQPVKSTGINMHDLRKFFQEKENHRKVASVFNKWKVAFVEKWLEIELDLWHTMRFSRKIILHLKGQFAEKKAIEEENTYKAESRVLSKFFEAWRNSWEDKYEQQVLKIALFKQRNFFKRWLEYHKNTQHKSNLYKYHLKSYSKKRLRAMLARWSQIARQNVDTRDFQRRILQRRALRVWQKKLHNRTVLKGLFTTMFEVATHYEDKKPNNDFQLLFKIVKAWRNEVIENGNTLQQKIDCLTAQNYYTNTLKYKTFRGWKLACQFNKALPIVIRHLKKNFSRNVLGKWLNVARQTHTTLYYFGEGQDQRLVKRCFHSLKTFNLQEKLIRVFNVRRYFLSWRTSHELNTFILPSKYRFRVLLRKSFRALRAQVHHKVQQLRQTFTATEYVRRTDLKALRLSFYAMIENNLKQKMKRLLNERVTSFCARFLKRRAVLGFKQYSYLWRTKQNKKYLADTFRKSHSKHLTLRIGSRFRVYPEFLSAAGLLLSAWRAIALKSKNMRMISNRFKRFKDRIRLRKHFIVWYDQYLKAAHNIVETPSFKVDYTKYLPTRTEKMKKSVRFEDEPVNKSQSDASTHDVSLDSSQSKWLQLYHENEAFMRKLQESRANETNYIRKYSHIH